MTVRGRPTATGSGTGCVRRQEHLYAAGAADHVEQLSQRYFGMPFPWPNGRDETRLILTIDAHNIYTPMG